DFSYEVQGLGRYRVNAHFQRGAIGLSMRIIKAEVPPLEDLNLPEIISRLTYLPRGLVLVTGDTGSGKSTSLAAMIQAMNERYRKHIITLEDPIEYSFQSNKCLLEQRELGADMPSFASGLKHALRQDPDIILVGEMRDLDTTALAISAAETGHLVLSTLHTVNASQTVERIIDMYPSGQQNQIRSMLGNTLQAVISQTLFSRMDQPGMVPAVEVMLCTPAVRNIIREARTFEIPNVIDTNRQLGMISLDNAIAQLYFNNMISREDAIAQAAYPDKLERQLAA
ncbi:MAG: type IV pilus twitching motility protein PilT, partial [Planctomycetota bacterium]